ncbi:MAG: uracil-DNA glycosylase [Bacteroidota bacterium]|nr:uracil-DNA glycosylase [Bacteroidota bacterium]
MKVKIEESWHKELKEIFSESFFCKLTKKVKQEYSISTVYPKGSKIFKAFNLCSFKNLKVVILGQDPYHGKNQANGLCFSVNENVIFPPSLKNIFKELKNNYPDYSYKNGDLSHWSRQGVLLLNSILTVRKGIPSSHKELGWEKFTDLVIEIISKRKDKVVFILWGSFAKSKIKLIDNEKHLVLTSTHPSPFSAHNGFFNQKHFLKTNNFLEINGLDKIIW